MSIREERYALLEQYDLMVKLHENDRRVMEKKLYELTTRCKHNWDYNPDPSGNNDSSYTCSECGKEVRRIPKDE